MISHGWRARCVTTGDADFQRSLQGNPRDSVMDWWLGQWIITKSIEDLVPVTIKRPRPSRVVRRFFLDLMRASASLQAEFAKLAEATR